jgi:protein involved in polysaccharide export with SLBB domain
MCGRAPERERTSGEWRGAGRGSLKLAPGWGRRGRARSQLRLLKDAIDVAKGMVKRVRRKRNVALRERERERVGVRRLVLSDRPPPPLSGVVIGISKTGDRHGPNNSLRLQRV